MLSLMMTWLRGLIPWAKRGLGYLVLGAVLAGIVFAVQLGAPKPQIQQQAQVQQQSQTQATNILTFNIGQYSSAQTLIKYDVVVYSGYAWDQDIIMGNAVRYVNAVPNICQQIGSRIIPVTYGLSCYVYILIPAFRSI